ncbi:MAG: FAD-dependent oxidoreductase [Lentisphaerae bacterium]|nr:FAD-dependent oxidoreductase [Lentisphaerota bacterium]
MKKYDVAIAGGGWAGICAAAAAAKRGAKTVLIEKSNCLGGLAGNGLIGGILGFQTGGKPGSKVIAGEFARIIDQLHRAGGCENYETARPPLMFNHDTFKFVAENYLDTLGVDILFHTTVIAAEKTAARIKQIMCNSSGGTEAVEAAVFVDCTGNGDLISQAGADHFFGRDGDGLVQALGLVVYFTEVDPKWVADREKIEKALAEERKNCRIRIYHTGVVASQSAWGNGQYSDMLRIGGIRAAADPRNAAAVSRAEIEMRRSAMRIMDICRRNSKAFDRASVIFPGQTGVRECRRMAGLTTIGTEDICNATNYPDAVARGVYWIDIHCPMGYYDDVFVCNAQCATRHECRQREEFHDLLPAGTQGPPENSYFTIPLRALCSRNIGNLMAAGRCISASSPAIAALRAMAICAATGEAAGAAAAMAAAKGCLPPEVDIEELQNDLRKNGALI